MSWTVTDGVRWTPAGGGAGAGASRVVALEDGLYLSLMADARAGGVIEFGSATPPRAGQCRQRLLVVVEPGAVVSRVVHEVYPPRGGDPAVGRSRPAGAGRRWGERGVGHGADGHTSSPSPARILPGGAAPGATVCANGVDPAGREGGGETGPRRCGEGGGRVLRGPTVSDSGQDEKKNKKKRYIRPAQRRPPPVASPVPFPHPPTTSRHHGSPPTTSCTLDGCTRGGYVSLPCVPRGTHAPSAAVLPLSGRPGHPPQRPQWRPPGGRPREKRRWVRRGGRGRPRQLCPLWRPCPAASTTGDGRCAPTPLLGDLLPAGRPLRARPRPPP